MAAANKTGGLAGVTAGETHLCTVGKEGTGLTYRGFDIYDLVDNASFEEVAEAAGGEERDTGPLSLEERVGAPGGAEAHGEGRQGRAGRGAGHEPGGEDGGLLR